MSNYLRERNYDGGWFDPFDDSFFNNLFYGESQKNIMKTDIIERDNEYEFIVEMPGVKKEEAKIELHDGNLIVSYELKNDDKKDDYIIRERKYYSASRSYYVGKGYKEEDIKAEFVDGILHITVPKEAKKQEKKYVTIA